MTKKLLPVSVLLAAAVLLALPLTLTARALPEFAALVDSYGPAVVNISTRQTRESSDLPPGHPFSEIPEDSPLYEFFRHFQGDGQGEPPSEGGQPHSLGSGFIVSADGFVLTNAHVVEAADEIIVRTSDRREFVAKVIGADKRSDIALIKVEAEGLPTVRIGTAKDLKVGEWMLAIGSPFGFEHSATAGIISAMGRSLPSESYIPFIQTDVAINPGNSGGPLFNLDGEVVGVNSQIYSRTGGFMGLSFAIPIDVAMDVVEQLKTKGRVSRGFLGVLIQDVTRDLAESFKMDQPSGALVAQVLSDSPAIQSDLRVGDVVLEFNGMPVPTSGALLPLVGVSPVGEAAKLTVLRGGETLIVEVVVGELPEEDRMQTSGEESPEPAQANRIGLVLEDLTAGDSEELGLRAGGVFVAEVITGAADLAGIRPGDILLSFDGLDVTDAARFGEILGAIEPGRSVAALIQRDDRRMFSAVRIPAE